MSSRSPRSWPRGPPVCRSSLLERIPVWDPPLLVLVAVAACGGRSVWICFGEISGGGGGANAGGGGNLALAEAEVGGDSLFIVGADVECCRGTISSGVVVLAPGGGGGGADVGIGVMAVTVMWLPGTEC